MNINDDLRAGEVGSESYLEYEALATEFSEIYKQKSLERYLTSLSFDEEKVQREIVEKGDYSYQREGEAFRSRVYNSLMEIAGLTLREFLDTVPWRVRRVEFEPHNKSEITGRIQAQIHFRVYRMIPRDNKEDAYVKAVKIAKRIGVSEGLIEMLGITPSKTSVIQFPKVD